MKMKKDVPSGQKLSADFWKFWSGQTISALGGSFTFFAVPLLVYKLTGSPVNLGIATAAEGIPYLLFGLTIGAWVDRVDRKRLMIWTDVARAAVVATVPLLSGLGLLEVWWLYLVGFLSSTLTIAFTSAEFAAIPSLVGTDELVTANGRIQASYSAANVAGPILAGFLAAVLSVESLLLVDAVSFVLSALALLAVGISFNPAEREQKQTSLREDIKEGLMYVLRHPVLRNISAMMALVNVVSVTVWAQLVFFAKERLRTSDSELGILMAAGSAGVVVLSLAAGPLRKRWPFSKVALGSLMLSGALTTVMAYVRSFWVAALLWAVISGLGIMFNINTGSLRQAVVPSHLLGRIMSVAMVLAWSANPLGTVLGGFLVEALGVVNVYAAIGILVVIIPAGFAFTALGRAEDYIKGPEEPATA